MLFSNYSTLIIYALVERDPNYILVEKTTCFFLDNHTKEGCFNYNFTIISSYIVRYQKSRLELYSKLYRKMFSLA